MNLVALQAVHGNVVCSAPAIPPITTWRRDSLCMPCVAKSDIGELPQLFMTTDAGSAVSVYALQLYRPLLNPRY
jgi:hypothetical protein